MPRDARGQIPESRERQDPPARQPAGGIPKGWQERGCQQPAKRDDTDDAQHRNGPDSVRVENGHILMPELPGIGFEGKSDLIKVMRELAE